MNVREFHKKQGFPLDVRLKKPKSPTHELLLQMYGSVAGHADFIEKPGLKSQIEGDPSLYRVHLILEEVGEMIEAMMDGDEVRLADALADLAYVTFGTAETYGIPLHHVLEEVHRSNMTKKVRSGPDDRMRDKGEGYTPPNIAKAIAIGRDFHRWNKELESE